MKKMSHQELLERQTSQQAFRPPLTAILNDVRSLYNVGSIFRTADGAGLEKLWLCGITGIPPDGMISKTALGAEKSVPWEYRRHAVDIMKELKAKGYQIVLLEQTASSVPFEEFKPQGPVCLVVGHEVSGVSEELLKHSDAAVEIEMAGLKISLNVTVAFGVVAYHLRNELKKQCLKNA